MARSKTRQGPRQGPQPLHQTTTRTFSFSHNRQNAAQLGLATSWAARRLNLVLCCPPSASAHGVPGNPVGQRLDVADRRNAGCIGGSVADGIDAHNGRGVGVKWPTHRAGTGGTPAAVHCLWICCVGIPTGSKVFVDKKNRLRVAGPCPFLVLVLRLGGA